MLAEEATKHPSPVRTISVVIPVKDDSELLARCLDALSAQTRRADEIIVVDNASSDDSAAVALAAGALVLHSAEPGIPATSARGYDAATGDLILRLDADCVPPSDWIAELEVSFTERPEIDAFTGAARFVDGPRAFRSSGSAAYLFAYLAATAPALGHLPLFGSNLAMRRSAWLAVSAEVHRDDPDIHDDLDLAFHLGEHHRLGYLAMPVMGISSRPFHSASKFRRRTYRGFRTVTQHWPHDFPPRRWKRLRLRHGSAWGRPRERAVRPG